MSFSVALSQGAINSPRGGLVKGGTEPSLERAGSVGPGRSAQASFSSVRPRFLPQLLLARFLICVQLHVGL
jgi:hypothetical protein